MRAKKTVNNNENKKIFRKQVSMGKQTQTKTKNNKANELVTETLDMSSGSIDNNNTNNSRETLTAAPKRGREQMQFSFNVNDNILKTPRLSTNDSPFKLLNLVDKRFDKITEVMKNLIQESEARMINEFDKRFSDLKTDISNITQRVIALETVADDIVSLKDEVGKLKTQLQRQENSLIASDLRINGVPYRDNEDLYAMFQDICGALNINTPAVKAIYRLQNHNNKDKENSLNAVIMVKLFSPYDKNFILKSIAIFRKHNKRSLLLYDIGEDSDRPFYVKENLTSNNFKILQAAVRLKNVKKLNSAFTMRGIVYIKFNADEQPIRIESMDELMKFFPDLGLSAENQFYTFIQIYKTITNF